MPTAKSSPGPKIEVRRSPIHGRGVYAARKLLRGERIIEYRGRRISWAQADRIPSSDPKDPNHTFLFSLSDGKTVIDAAQGGNAARWINHACDPNCETEETDDGRVFIQAVRDIPRGQELNYDYGLIIDERITPTLKRQYLCLCGSPKCRGTMLAVRKPAKAKPAKAGAKKTSAKKKAPAKTKAKAPAGAKKATKGTRKATSAK